MLKLALGILIGWATVAVAQNTAIVSTQGYIICVPPWPTTDAFGNVHAGGK